MSGGVSESKRNWPEYNEFLVRRGELYLTFTFLENWDADLDEINRDKLGRKFESPPSFIQFLMMVHVIFNLPYRQMEGFLRKLADIVPQIRAADYTTIWRRGTKLDIKLVDTLKESDEPVVVALDSSGIKVTNRGEWMREKWKIHRGWIKVNLSVNVKTKEIVGIKVTDETVSDGSNFVSLMDQSANNLPDRKIEKQLPTARLIAGKYSITYSISISNQLSKLDPMLPSRIEDRLPELRRLRNCRLSAINLGNKITVMAGDGPWKLYSLQ